MRSLFLGEFQPTLENALTVEARRIREDDPLARILVVVPNRLLARHLSFLLGRELGGWMGLEIMTHRRLAEAVAGPTLARESSTRLNPLAQELLLARVIESDLGQAGFLHPLRGTPGLPSSLRATFEDLAEGEVEPQDLMAAAASGRLPSTLARKTTDLARALAQYRQRLDHESCYDSTDAFTVAAQEAAGSCFLARHEALFVYGFYDLNPLQRTFFREVVKERSVAVFFPHGGGPAFEYAEDTLTWFRSMGFREERPGRPLPGENTLGQMRASLFDDARREEIIPDDSLLVLCASSEEQELREALRVVVGRLRQADEPITSGILLRHPEEYAQLLAECAAGLDLPLALGDLAGRDAEPDAGRSRFEGQSALLLLNMRLAAKPGSPGERLMLNRRDVMELATLALPGSSLVGGSGEEARALPSAWDNLTVRLGIRDDPDWEERLTPLAKESRVAETLLHFVGELREALAGLPAHGRWSDLAESLRRALERILGRQVDSSLEDACRELAALEGICPETDLGTFARFLARALAREGDARAPAGDAPVRAGLWAAGLMAARGVPADIVIIPGLTEAGFPRRPRQDPLLLDHERRQLNQLFDEQKAGSPTRRPDHQLTHQLGVGASPDGERELTRTGPRLGLKLERIQEERLLFRLALGAARQCAVLTMSRLDPATGRDRIPSPFLLEVHRAATGQPPSYAGVATWRAFRRLPLPGLPHTAPEEALETLEFDLASFREHRDRTSSLHSPRPGGVARFVRRPDLMRRLESQEARWGTGDLNPHTGLLQSTEALSLLTRPESAALFPISPTRLETYGRCPQAYFLQHVLGLEPLEEPERTTTLPARDRGILYHRILHVFLSVLLAKGLLPWDAEKLPVYARLLEGLTEEELRRFRRENAIGLRLFWEEETEQVRADLARFLREELEDPSGYQPAYLELAFGRNVPPEGSGGGRARGRAARPGDHDAAHDRDIGKDEDVVVDLRAAREAPGDHEPFRLRLRGRIDRVDMSPDAKKARILDYKTGDDQIRRSDPLQGGRALQLPLYAMAAEVFLQRRHPHLTVEEAAYYRVRQRKAFGKSALPRKEWMEREGELREICRLFQENIGTGRFFPSPLPAPEGCARCDFHRVCGPGMHALAERKQGDERTRFLRRIRGNEP